MSTENLFHNSPDGQGQSPPLLLFLALSLLMHGLVYLLVIKSGSLGSLTGDNDKTVKDRAVEVEMVALPSPEKKSRWTPVIDLPSTVKSNAPAKKEVLRYADRSVSVARESVPEPGADTDTTAATRRATGKTGKTGAATPVTAPIKRKAETAEKQKSDNDTAAEATTHKKLKGEGAKQESTKGRVVPPHMKSTDGESGEKAKRPSLFPSPERLAALAKSSPGTTRRGRPGKILQLNTTELIYTKYLLNVRDRVSFYWEYPMAAVRNGWQGTLTIDFVILRDGAIIDVKIDRSSGYPVLDDAAITAIKLAGPFFAFPEYFVLDRLNVRYQFEYRLTSLPGPAN